MKYCPKCKTVHPLTSFYYHKNKPVGYCKTCWCDKKVSKEKKREYYLKSKFNITVEHYMQLYADQGGGCAICGKNITIEAHTKDMSAVACIDHNHTTGTVRGLLCNHCNTGIGLLQENPVILKSAINYLLDRGVK